MRKRGIKVPFFPTFTHSATRCYMKRVIGVSKIITEITHYLPYVSPFLCGECVDPRAHLKCHSAVVRASE